MPTLAEYEDWKAGLQKSSIGAANVVLSDAQTVNPDQFAGDVKLGRAFGLPAGIVAEGRDGFAARLQAKRNETILNSSPLMASWLGLGDNAKVAHDDLESLSWFEAFGKQAKEAAKGIPGGAVSSAGTALEGAGQLLTPRSAEDRKPIVSAIATAGTKTPDEISALRQEIFKQGVVNPTIAQSILSDVISGDMTPDEAMQALEPAIGPILSAASENLQAAGERLQEDASSILPATPGMEDSIGRQVGSGLGSFLTILATAVATGGVGAGVVSGLMGAGEATSIARQAGQDEDTQTISGLYGILPGLTDVIPVERFLNNPVTRHGFASLLRRIGAQGLTEGGQEVVQQLMQNAIAQNLYAPDKSMMDDVFQSFTTGGLVGALVEAGKIAVTAALPGRVKHAQSSANKAEETQVTAEKIAQAAQTSKLKQRLDERFLDWVNSAVSGSPVENVYVPAEAMDTFFQGARVDPEDFIAELPGVSMEEFRAALGTGGDLKIPTGVYAAKIAGTEFDPFLRENMRFDPDAMTLAQAKDFNERVADIQREAFEEAEHQRLSDEELRSHEQVIYDDMVSRLRAAGRSTDVATTEAMLYPAFYRTMAERSGLTIDEFVAKYPLPQVEGERPEGLQPKNVDAFNRLLAELRGRRDGRPARESLLEFIDRRGGINDPGGELAARDAQVVKRGAGKKTLHIRRGVGGKIKDMFGGGSEFGMDRVAQAAVENGYLADDPRVQAWKNAVAAGEQTPDITAALLDAIDAELAGNPSYSQDQVDAVRDDLDRRLDDAEDWLSRRGISLDDPDDVIRSAVEAADADGRGYGQASGIDLSPGGGSKQYRLGDTVIDYGISRDGQTAEIILVKTPRSARGRGSARRALSDLLTAFDGARLTTFLTAEPMDKGISKAKLIEFYRSLGFRENKGRHKDFRSQAAMVREPARLFSQSGDVRGARGSIQFPGGGVGNGDTVIRLFQSADLSTMLHESGHYFLTVMQDLAAKGEAGSIADFDAIKAWWRSNAADVAKDGMRVMPDVALSADDVIVALDNGTTGDVLKDAAIDVGMQEQWARGFETYLMEGKAPSIELRGAFEKFRAWLISVYRRLAGLNVNISDDIRRVFDRMLASDAEIAKAQSSVDDEMLFKTAAEAGISEDQFRALASLHDQAQDDAKARMMKEAMAPIKRERDKWFKDERAKVREEVEKDINGQRAYRAIEWLGNRRWLGEGKPDDMPDMRMSKDMLVAQYGEGVLKTLPRGKFTVYAVEGGMDPDEVAGWFGYNSGDELVKALETAPARKDAIEAETDRLMRERHGDVLRDGSAEEAALKAVHGDKRGQYLAAELKTLKALVGDNSADITMQDAREIARRTLSRLQVRDAVNSRRYLAAERRHADDVIRLSRIATRERMRAQGARRDVGTTARQGIRSQDGAALERTNAAVERANVPTDRANDRATLLVKAARNRLINHALYAESVKIADEVEKAERLVAKLEKATRKIRSERRRLGEASIAGDYVEAIEAIIYGYEFRKVSGARINRRAALLSYVEMMTEAGRANELAIPQSVLDDASTTNYRALTVEHLRGVIDSLKNIEHAARLKGKLLINNRMRDFHEVTDSVADAIKANVKGRPVHWVRDDGITAVAVRGITGYISTIQSATTILRQIDGRKDLGPAYEAMKSDMDEAAHVEREMRKEATEKILDLYSVYSKDEQRQMAVREVVPELGGQSFSKWNLIAMALNMGNEGNLARLTNEKARMHLTEAQVEIVKAKLDKRDWDFVQSVWDYINSYRARISERDKRIRGIEPTWVDAAPVTTPFGVYRGGYYPIKYEGRLGGARFSSGGSDNDILNSMMASGYSSAHTKDGHLKARGENVRQSLTLDMSVIAQHANEVIHDLAFSEAVVNTWRILTSNRVEQAMLNAGLDEHYKMLKLWVQDAATGQVAAGGGLARSVSFLRSGFTYSKLALNLKTILLQPLGLFQSAVVVGKRNLAEQMIRYVKNPVAMADDVLARSRMMWERRETFNKDLMDAAAKSNMAGPASGKVRMIMDDYVIPFGMAGITYSQFYLVDIPTWAAAFQNGVKQFDGDETKAAQFADMTIQRSQGSGIWSDRSGIERGSLSPGIRQNPFVMLMTTLGSYFFAKMNLIIERTQGLRAEPITAGAAMSYALDMTLLLAGEAAVIALVDEAFDDDDDDDDSITSTIAMEAMQTFLAGLPGVRDVAGLSQGFQAGTYASILQTFWAPIGQAKQGEIDKALVKSTVNLAGLLLRLPSSQANRIIDGAWRDIEGEDVSPLEYLVGRQH